MVEKVAKKKVMYLKQGKIDYSTRLSATEMTLSYPLRNVPFMSRIRKNTPLPTLRQV